MHHVALRTRSVSTLARFYEAIVGLERVRETPAGSVWLRAGETIVMIEARAEEEPDVPAKTMDLLAFAIAAHERDTWRSQLTTRGVAIESESDHSIYFRDPDGRRLALSDYPTDTLRVGVR